MQSHSETCIAVLVNVEGRVVSCPYVHVKVPTLLFDPVKIVNKALSVADPRIDIGGHDIQYILFYFLHP